MLLAETKKLIISLLVLAAAVFLLPQSSVGQDYSSSSFTVNDPVIDSGTQTSSSLNFGLGQSLSQMAIGKSASASFQLWSGYQYYFEVDPNTLTATPGNCEVDLAWTVPQTFLGVNVGGYEVGTGTVSGSYTFEDVGNVTSFTKTGLTGVPYYFVIQAYSPGGSFVVFSNEDAATPTCGVTPPPPGSGSVVGGSIMVTGTAYPGASVTLLRDSSIVGNVTASATGQFSFSLNSQPAGTYTYGVYAADADGYTSPTVGFERTIQTNVQASMSGVLVAPTLRQSHTAVRQGDSLTFSGYAAPNVLVYLRLAGPQSQVFPLTSSAAGLYTYSLPTGAWPRGAYTALSYAAVNGQNTPNSFTLNFSIGDQTVLPPVPGDCSKRSDLNCDGRVNLIDFSILLYFWDLRDFTRNPRADIDKNGDVELRDLSIMLYDWTG